MVLLPDDVATKAMSFLSLPDWQAASACKAYHACWRRRCRGMLRVVRQRVGRFEFADHLTALPGSDGIIVPHYAEDRLETYSPNGVQVATCVQGRSRVVSDDESISGSLETPSAMALRGDGTAWVILKDDGELVCVRLDAVISENIVKIGFWDLPEDHADYGYLPVDVALAGDRLLVLCCAHPSRGRVQVLDNQTGARLYTFGSTGEDWRDELREPNCLAVHDQYCFIADTHNQAVKVFDWRDGTLVRAFGKAQDHSSSVRELMIPYYADEVVPYYSFRNDYSDVRKGSGPGEFNTPFGVAVRDGKLYVSELEGRRIQVFRLPADMRGFSDMEVLQIIPSPDGWPLSGLCVDEGGRLSCMGPGVTWSGGSGGSNCRYVFDDENNGRHASYLHIFEPVFQLQVPSPASEVRLH